MNNKPYLLALNHLQINLKAVYALLKKWPSLADCFNASPKILQEAGLSDLLIDKIKNFPWDLLKADEAFESRPGQTILTILCPNYPALLKEISDPPPILYAKGHLACLHQPMLAMVGSRHPSPMGRQIAFEWARELSLQGLMIVSGLAIGIDGAAHQGALAGRGETVAILGTGQQVIYPANHKKLTADIVKQGLILSEFPLHFPPRAGHFPRRNRIISGLCQATLVVEAALKSGSLITARYALEQNRDVFALPGSIHLQQAQGCHHLLKQGAALVTSYQDVLLELGLSPSPHALQQAALKTLTEQQKQILDCIGVEPTHVDTITLKSQQSIPNVIQTLAQLEIMGNITAIQGRYARLIK